MVLDGALVAAGHEDHFGDARRSGFRHCVLDQGMSTTGSISLGIAFVAGRKRVPRPLTGNTTLRTGFIVL